MNKKRLDSISTFIKSKTHPFRVWHIKNEKPKSVTVKTISHQMHLQYRDWVESNKEYVHKKSKNKIGYIHIPDMGPFGFAEFHRHFLSEISYDGLVVDVRYNGGGHVSHSCLVSLQENVLVTI